MLTELIYQGEIDIVTDYCDSNQQLLPYCSIADGLWVVLGTSGASLLSNDMTSVDFVHPLWSYTGREHNSVYYIYGISVVLKEDFRIRCGACSHSGSYWRSHVSHSGNLANRASLPIYTRHYA